MMSASQDFSQKFHEYDSDDRQLLVGLLHEYSDKLIEASREVARTRAKTGITGIVIAFPAFILSFSLSYLFWILLDRNSSIISGLDSVSFRAIVFCSTFVLFPGVMFFLKTINVLDFFYFDTHDRLRKIENDLLERDARLIADRLESAMRLTVEIADRVEANLARKLELDLRIGDASSALEYYYSVVNLKLKSQSKSRKVAS